MQRLSTPENQSRVETGAIQFGDDHPGLYISGDWCFELVKVIRYLEVHHPTGATAELYMDQLSAIKSIIEDEVL